VNFGSTGGNVAVTETNASGCVGTQVSKAVTVNALPSTLTITGNDAVCANQANVPYSVTSTVGSIYGWTVPSGASVAGGQGTASITVNFGSTGGNVAVTETNASGCMGTQVSKAVTIVPKPVIESITQLGTDVTLVWSSVLGQTYRVQYTIDLTPIISWTTLTPDVTATGATATYTDSFGAATQRFYRVVLLCH
jgi:hypothetical protein